MASELQIPDLGMLSQVETYKDLGPLPALWICIRSVCRVSSLQNGRTPPDELLSIKDAIVIASDTARGEPHSVEDAKRAYERIEEIERHWFVDYGFRKMSGFFNAEEDEEEALARVHAFQSTMNMASATASISRAVQADLDAPARQTEIDDAINKSFKGTWDAVVAGQKSKKLPRNAVFEATRHDILVLRSNVGQFAPSTLKGLTAIPFDVRDVLWPQSVQQPAEGRTRTWLFDYWTPPAATDAQSPRFSAELPESARTQGSAAAPQPPAAGAPPQPAGAAPLSPLEEIGQDPTKSGLAISERSTYHTTGNSNPARVTEGEPPVITPEIRRLLTRLTAQEKRQVRRSTYIRDSLMTSGFVASLLMMLGVPFVGSLAVAAAFMLTLHVLVADRQTVVSLGAAAPSSHRESVVR